MDKWSDRITDIYTYLTEEPIMYTKETEIFKCPQLYLDQIVQEETLATIVLGGQPET